MDELNDNEESEYDFWSNFTCPKCQAYVEVFHHKSGIVTTNESDL